MGEQSGPVAGWYGDPSGRHEHRFWDGASWTGYVSDDGRPSVDSAAPSLPDGDRSRSVTPPRQRGTHTVLRRVLWNVYALPVTVLFLSLSVSAIATLGAVGIFDALLSLPQYVALQLHIWDKRTLNPFLWKAYAFTFLVWQIAFGFFIEPKLSGAVRGSTPWVGFLIQLPMLIALFLYAFRDWSGSTETRPTAVCRVCGNDVGPKQRCPYCGERLVRSNARLVTLSVTAAVLGGVTLLLYSCAYIPRVTGSSIPDLLFPRRVFDTTLAPPRQPARISYSTLSDDERARLRGMFERGEYDALNHALTQIQLSFQKDPSQDETVCDAFDLFSRPGDEPRLDAWVAHDAEQFAPYLARAQYHYWAGWATRGYSSGVTSKQLEEMRDSFDKASADLDAAISRNPDVLSAYVTRIGIAMAEGRGDVRDAGFRRASARFPHSLALYEEMVHAKLPRWGGSYEEMDRIAKAAILSNPGDNRFYELIGMIYADQSDVVLREGDLRVALQLIQKSLAFSQTAENYEQRARVYFDMSKNQLALDDVNQSLLLSPDTVSARLLRATMYLDRGDKQSAWNDARRAEAVSPGDSAAVEQWKKWAVNKAGAAPK